MTKPATILASAPNAAANPLNPTIETLIAREDALFAAAEARGLDLASMNALATLRDAVGFLDLMSEGIAKGLPFDCPETAESFRWSVMKLVEFNDMLPHGLRGRLSYDCFMADPVVKKAH